MMKVVRQVKGTQIVMSQVLSGINLREIEIRVSKLGGIELLGVWELRKVMRNLGLAGIELENTLQSRARIVVQSQLLDDRIPVQIMQRMLVQVKRVLWPWQHHWMN
jgi:hypothetical protein